MIIMTDSIQYGKYQHYKNKKFYEVLGVARHSETLEEMIVYKALYHRDEFGSDQVWVRPKAMFFENVVHEGAFIARFSYVGEKE